MAQRYWIQEVADRVEAHHAKWHPNRDTIVCASGISPSGPIHLGNLREIMTVQLVADELRRRGRAVDHLHSWDDFDRLRKIPAGVPEAFREHIGRPLCDVPDPWGEYGSWAERHMQHFAQSVAEVAVTPRYIRQSEAYRAGKYVPQIEQAMAARLEIFDTLAKFQTANKDEDDPQDRRQNYYPFRVYCQACNRDTTTINEYQAESATIDYTCNECGHTGSFSLRETVPGKLVWKVDWPMRWSYEGVDFEPGGEDHSSPGSSYTVGKILVKQVYAAEAPMYVGYAFVGAGGRTKIASSAGTSAIPSVALRIIEPAILRWLYARREPRQKFNIDFGQEVLRLYDEWDSLGKRVADGGASALDAEVYQRSVATVDGPVVITPRPVPFRLLSSLADVTLGNTDEMLRILADHLDDGSAGEELRAAIEPRLSCALHWATEYVPDDERTTINPAFDAAAYAELGDQDRQGIRLLLEQLHANWSSAGLTSIIYGVPKQLLNLPLDVKPTPELKATQRQFFIALYRLICAAETGPRLPTLFLALGEERVRQLLAP